MDLHFDINHFLRRTAAISGAFLIAITQTGCGSKQDTDQETYKQAGIEALATGDYAQAITSLQAALDAADSSVGTQEYDISYYLAAAEYLNGAFDDAINTYTAMMDINPQDAGPVFLRGSIYADENELDHAASDYKEAIRRQPDDYDLYIHIYEHLDGLGYTEEGLQYLNQALSGAGSGSDDYLGRGRIYLLLGQYDAAEVALNHALSDRQWQAYAYLCRLYGARSDQDRARQYLDAYKSRTGLDASDFVLIAEIEMDMSDYETALEDISTGISRSSSDEASLESLRRDEIACLEHLTRYQDAYDKTVEYIADYPADLDMPGEQAFLTVLLTDYEKADEESSSESESSSAGAS